MIKVHGKVKKQTEEGEDYLESVTEVYCDKCKCLNHKVIYEYYLGQPPDRRFEPEFPRDMFHSSQEWGYHSKRDTILTKIDLCEDCFEEVLAPYCTEETYLF